MLQDLICEIEEFLEGLFLHGISNIRNEDIDWLDRTIRKLENYQMDRYVIELKNFGSLMRKSINSKSFDERELMDGYFVLCGYTFIIKG